jgi:hypothetical protein
VDRESASSSIAITNARAVVGFVDDQLQFYPAGFCGRAGRKYRTGEAAAMAVENEPISGPIGALLLPHVKDEAYRSPPLLASPAAV